MDFNAILSTLADQLPELNTLLASASQMIPANINFPVVLKFSLFLLVGMLGMGIVGRVLLGRKSNLNHVLSCSMGILLIYVLTVVVYTFQPWELERFLSPLPFATFLREYLWILPFHGTSFELLCSNILSLVILAFLINLIDSILPEGESIPGWYALRFLTVLLAMGLHLAANWAIKAYLPNLLVVYAPSVLLIILISALLVGLAKVVLGVALTVVSPVIGAIYTFFFSSRIGVQLTKSVGTTIVLCGIFYLMEYFNYSVICISYDALISYIPLLGSLLILWYLLGHEL